MHTLAIFESLKKCIYISIQNSAPPTSAIETGEIRIKLDLPVGFILKSQTHSIFRKMHTLAFSDVLLITCVRNSASYAEILLNILHTANCTLTHSLTCTRTHSHKRTNTLSLHQEMFLESLFKRERDPCWAVGPFV